MSAIDALGLAMRNALGGFTVDEVQQNCKGIRIPHFAERWIWDSNVYLSGRFTMFIGKYGSGKSSYLFQVGRRFMEMGGLFVYLETEQKYTAGFARAHLGKWADSNQFIGYPVGTMDGEEEKQKGTIKKNKTEEELDAEELKKIGWLTRIPQVIKFIKNSEFADVPVCIGVDSLLGAPTKENLKQFDNTKGEMKAQDTSALRRASLMTKWLPVVLAEIADTNICLFGINHAKDVFDMNQGKGRGWTPPPETRWSGGNVLSMHANAIYEFKRGSKHKESIEEEGRSIYIAPRKASNGYDERRISIDFTYSFYRGDDGEIIRDASGNPIRLINWNWDRSTMDVLCRYFDPDFEPDSWRGPAEYRKSMTIHPKRGTYTFAARNPDNPRDILWRKEDLSLQEAAEFVETPEMEEFFQNFELVHHMVHNEFNYLEDE